MQMKKTPRLLIGIFLILLLGAGAYFWAMGMFSSNYAYRSPLRNAPPAPGEALGESSSRQVVIVLVDGLKAETAGDPQLMPRLFELSKNGAAATMKSRAPSFSQGGYTTLLTGAWPEINDGPIFNLEYDQIPTWTQDNLFSAAHRKGIKTAVAGYYWFEKLIPRDAVDYSFYTPGEDQAADQAVMEAALPWLKAGNAGLVLIHLDQMDYAAHNLGGAKSAAWNEAAQRVDGMIGQVAAALDLGQDTLVVVSDHGHIDTGGHGGQDEVVLTEPFVMAGAGVVQTAYRTIQMVDVAPTVAALLGTNLPADAQGEVLTNVLKLPQSVTNSLPAAVQAQQTALVKAYAGSLGMTLRDQTLPTGSDVAAYQAVMDQLRNDRIFVQRVERSAVAAVLLALIVFFLLRNQSKGSLWWIASGLTFLGIFNYRYALWDQLPYSISAIKSETDFILYVLVTSAIAFTIAWLVTALGRRTFWQKPMDAALSTTGLILAMLFITGLPVLWSFVMNGVLVTWTLPEYGSSFVALLGLIQGLSLAVFGLAALAVTALVTWLGQRRKSIPKREKRK
jgi:hypothetical protein